MTTLLSPPPTVRIFRTLADLQERLGGVPEDRIRLSPPVGTATAKDVVNSEATDDRLCELVAGVLVEKPMGWREAILALWLARHLDDFVRPRDLGVIVGPDGPVELTADVVRIPDVAFIHWDRLPDDQLPTDPIPGVVPNLAIEILSRSNTAGEMRVKRTEYFPAGVALVWEIDPVRRTVAVYTAVENPTVLTEDATLTGGTVLPGFELPVRTLFGELDRRRERRTRSE